jgi:hypothetical protein
MKCDKTGKRVLPYLLERSAATGKMALKPFFVSSSISGARLLPEEGMVSATGKYCLQSEARLCEWSGKPCHPDDLRKCELTQISVHFEFMTTNGKTRLEALSGLLTGVRRRSDKQESWPTIAAHISQILDSRSEVEAAVLSPGEEMLAVCVETRNWFGLKTRQAGLVYDLRDCEAVGKIVVGKRSTARWEIEKTI